MVFMKLRVSVMNIQGVRTFSQGQVYILSLEAVN